MGLDKQSASHEQVTLSGIKLGSDTLGDSGPGAAR
jgi:hypothetical protein